VPLLVSVYDEELKEWYDLYHASDEKSEG